MELVFYFFSRKFTYYEKRVTIKSNSCYKYYKTVSKGDFFMAMIDLHVHSTASDGTYSPSQVVELAKKAGLTAIALTDHDTVRGVGEASKAGQAHRVRVIPGIELSSNYEGTEIHILGLFVRSDDKEFLAALERFSAIRQERNRVMLNRFEAAGIHLPPEILTGSNPDTVITRAHVARALVSLGYSPSMDQAFQKYLQYGGKYCPPKNAPAPETIVRTLKDNGAFVSLAHPMQYKLGDSKLYQLVSAMKSWGMEGIEVYHSSHNSLDIRKLSDLARQLSLLPTGGSDFHGSNKPKIAIGVGRGNLQIDESLLENIDILRRKA